MKDVMDVPGFWESKLVHHGRNLLNDLEWSESPGHKLTRCFQMEIAGVQPDLIANLELFIGEARLPRNHRFLRPLVRDYCLISVCR